MAGEPGRLPIPHSNRDGTARKPYFSVRRIARIAILIALSAVGALVKIPSPTGTVALDSAPAFMAAAAFSPAEGAIIAALGHLVSAATAGFPLSLPVHLIVAAEMAAAVWVFGALTRHLNVWVAAVVGIILNGVAAPAVLILIGGVGMFVSLVLPLTVGSVVNVAIASGADRALQQAGLAPRRRKKTAPSPDPSSSHCDGPA